MSEQIHHYCDICTHGKQWENDCDYWDCTNGNKFYRARPRAREGNSMANYTYYCEEHGEIEVQIPMSEVGKCDIYCPHCDKLMRRVWKPVNIDRNAPGFFGVSNRK